MGASTSSLPQASAVLGPSGSGNASRFSLLLRTNLASRSHDSLTHSPTDSRSMVDTSSTTHVNADSSGQLGGAPFPKAYSKAHLGPRPGSTYSSDSGSGSPSGSYNAQLRDLVASQHTPPLAWTSRKSSPSGSLSQLLPARSASPQTSQWSPGAPTFNSRTSGMQHAGAPSSLSLPGAGILPGGGKDKAAYSSMPSLPAPSPHGSSRAPSVSPFSYASIAARGRVEPGQRSSAPSVTASTPSVSSDRPYGQGSYHPTVNLNLDADADPWMQTMVSQSATSLDAPQYGTGDGLMQGDPQPQTTPDGTSGHGRSAMSRLASSLSFGTRKKKRATKTK
ncbi:hypothetical protein C8Q76DRAFT_689640 [Earliella scabrosa]|nr:hypothetical protein C8Q76DRAFT_689640 [Earliella scabrosa]